MPGKPAGHSPLIPDPKKTGCRSLNPAGNHIVISGLYPVKGTLVVGIYSLQGQELLVEPVYVPGQRFDINRTEPGSYFIRVNDGNGIITGKFIKL